MNIDDLRQQIDAQHQKALDALETINRYLELPNGKQAILVGHVATKHRERTTDGKSNRDRVLEVISLRAASVPEIAAESGLDIKQVRGVLNAPSFTKKLERSKGPGGQKLYKSLKENAE